jgi:hypothetical protein
MKITDFAELIRCMPYREQAFDVKYNNWKESNQNKIIKEIFNDNEIITISRGELLNQYWNIHLHVIKILMWGYPTKGRGKNIDNFLEPTNFKSFIEKLELAKRNKYISIYEIKDLMKSSSGLGFSTLSKILYFSGINHEAFPALILDLRVISALKSGRFEDLGIEKFKNMKYENAVKNYENYLKFMHSLAEELQTDSDRVEMFLFEFGLNLKELTGEEGDWNLLDD